MSAKVVEILLVEDNPGDVLLTKRAFAKSKIVNALHVVSDGAEALDFLARKGRFADAVRPDLILLDINLPKVDGHEFLNRVKADEELRGIPVVMLTSSEREADVSKAYAAHANSYISKPPSLEELIVAMRGLEDYWFQLVRLPPGEQ